MSGHEGHDIFINLRTGKVAVVLGNKAKAFSINPPGHDWKGEYVYLHK